MHILDIAIKSKTVRKYFLQKKLEQAHENLLYEADYLENKLMQNIYCQLINCAKADIYELYLEIMKYKSAFDNVLADNIDDFIYGLYGWFSFYNLAEFGLEREDIFSDLHIFEPFFKIFRFDEKSEEIYNDFLELSKEDKALFEIEFYKYVMNELNIDEIDERGLIALIGNFFYNSYTGFSKSFTNYISVNANFYKARELEHSELE